MPAGFYQHKKGYKRPPFSEEWRKNLGLANKGKTAGEKNAAWKGGISKAEGYAKRKAKESYHRNLKKREETLAKRRKPENCEICGASCNLILGPAKDSIDLLNEIIEYLKKDDRE